MAMNNVVTIGSHPKRLNTVMIADNIWPDSMEIAVKKRMNSPDAIAKKMIDEMLLRRSGGTLMFGDSFIDFSKSLAVFMAIHYPPGHLKTSCQIPRFRHYIYKSIDRA
jgi:hypothetical protein